MTAPRLHPLAEPFIAYLQRYKSDRGALARLRGAMSEARRPDAWPLLGGFKPAVGDAAFETTAALWAYAPENDTAKGNLGDTLARIRKDHGSFEARFKRLLSCRDTSEISERIAPIVRAILAKGGRINYAQLLSDLLWWGGEINPPKVAWARSFWGATEDNGSINPALLDEEEATV